MTDILITFGFGWMIVAAIVGLLLAKRHEEDIVLLEKAADSANLAEYHRIDDSFKWRKLVHVHSFLFSVVAVCVGLVMGRMNYPEVVFDSLAIALIASTVVWTVGALIMNKPLMAISDVVFLLSLITVTVGLGRAL